MTPRRIAAFVGVSLIALAALHAGAWFVIAGRFGQGIDRWAAERRTDGWTVAYSSREVEGFPFAWRARVVAPHLERQDREPAFLWAGPHLDLDWRPWQPDTIGFLSAGEHRLGYGPATVAQPARLRVAAASGRLDFAAGGELRRLALQIEDAVLTPQAGEALRLSRLFATLDAAPAVTGKAGDSGHMQPSLQVEGELFGLTLPEEPRPALGRTVGHIALRGAVMGRLPAANPRRALDRWRRDGGTVEIERLELGWSALTVQAEGTLALDAGLRPIGALTARVTGFSETADALMASGVIEPGQAMVAKLALGALARVPAGGGKPEIDVPLAAQEGWLFVGPVKLAPLPPIRWE